MDPSGPVAPSSRVTLRFTDAVSLRATHETGVAADLRAVLGLEGLVTDADPARLTLELTRVLTAGEDRWAEMWGRPTVSVSRQYIQQLSDADRSRTNSVARLFMLPVVVAGGILLFLFVDPS